MYHFLPVMLILILFNVSCKTNKKVQAAAGPNTTAVMPADPQKAGPAAEVYALQISFFSRGEGTDYKMQEALEAYLTDFQKQQKKELVIEKYRWGREGEIDYCFPLKELKDKEKQAFIQGVQDLLKTTKLVILTRDAPCLHKR